MIITGKINFLFNNFKLNWGVVILIVLSIAQIFSPVGNVNFNGFNTIGAGYVVLRSRVGDFSDYWYDDLEIFW